MMKKTQRGEAAAVKQTVKAYAKINLALDVLGKREDGYHELCMVMQTVSLCDELEIAPAERGFAFYTDGSFTPKGEKTLEQQAAEAFFGAIDRPVPPMEVTLHKVTPPYAGLGGGSADVAALLRALRAEYAPKMADEELEAIGLSVGSDMPFCIRGGTALAEGRGEKLTDLPPLMPCWIVICKPDFGISTPTIFARADSCQLTCRPDIAGMMTALETQNRAALADSVRNVLEEALAEEQGEVFTIKRRLLELGADAAAMSGSGPAVFGLFWQKEPAQDAAKVLKEVYRETFLAQPVGKF